MFSVPLQVPSPSLLLHTDASVRLGAPHSGSDGCRSVVPRGEFSPHQCAGDESCCSGSGSLSVPVVGPECHPDERQRHSCHSPPESGRCSVSCLVLHGRQGSALDREPFSLPPVFKGLCKVFSSPHLDLFATYANAKLPLTSLRFRT